MELFPQHIQTVDTVRYEVSYQSEPNLPYSPIANTPYSKSDFLYTVCFIILLAFIRMKGKDFFQHVFQVLIKRRSIESVQNESVFSYFICYLLSLFASFSILSGCISIAIEGTFMTLNTLYYFLALIGYHFVLLSIIQILAWTFNARAAAQEVIANLWPFHVGMGLLISPFVLAFFYIPDFAIEPLLKIVIFGLVLLSIVKVLRWIEILYVYKVSIFYLILYLCALEIIPLLFLYKVVL